MLAHKRLIILLMVICLSVVPCFANMPVIDITAITQAIASYAQTISQWQTQLKQWKSEFDRIEKAAKGIANGDYMTILSSIASLTGQMSSWNLSKTVLNSAFLDDALEATSDSTYSLISLMNNSSLLQANISSVIKAMQKNAEKLASVSTDKAAGGVVGGGSNAASTTLSLGDNVLQLVKNMLLDGSDILSDSSEIYNNFASLFEVSPEDYALLYRDIQEDQLRSVAGVTTSSELKSKIDDLYSDLSDKENQLSNLKSSEDQSARADMEHVIASLKEDIASKEEVYSWSLKMDEFIAKVSKNQAVYEANKYTEERKEVYDNIAAAEQEYADTLKTSEDKLKELYSKELYSGTIKLKGNQSNE